MQRLASEEGIRIRSREGKSRVGRGIVAGQAVLLALPQTYMNASGGAVADLCEKNEIAPADLCVVFDEVALPLGTLRMRARGSAGGQRGIESVIARLGTPGFPRLRVGIRGARYSREKELADYVLEPFGRGERALFDESVTRAVEALRLWLTHGIEAAMRHANPKPSSPEPEPASG